MSIYDKIENADHQITLLVGMQAGVSTYACEKCGAIFKIRDNQIILFHHHGYSAEFHCERGKSRIDPSRSLDSKLRKLTEADFERLKNI